MDVSRLGGRQVLQVEGFPQSVQDNGRIGANAGRQMGGAGDLKHLFNHGIAADFFQGPDQGGGVIVGLESGEATAQFVDHFVRPEILDTPL